MAILTRVRFGIACVLAALVVTPALRAQDATAENNVKAAYLYNFTKFIEWPATAIGDRFRICIVGDRLFSAAVDAIIAGESAQNRPLVRVEPQTTEEARACQILYLSRSEPERAARMLAAVRQAPVLTVGDGAQFLEQGGGIRFMLLDGRMRFDIATRPLDRAGLRVSSKLLRVARKIDDGTVRP